MAQNKWNLHKFWTEIKAKIEKWIYNVSYLCNEFVQIAKRCQSFENVPWGHVLP